MVMKNIYLVGFMGTGKTTVGKLLAKKLRKEFAELDELIEKKEQRKITDIFSQSGETYFRQLENDLLKKISTQSNLVVSCGGGLMCNKNNIQILKNSGIVFNLEASSATIYKRTKDFAHRPLLNVQDPLMDIENLLQQRKPYYAQAHYAIDTEKKTPEEIVDAIIIILKEIKQVK